MHTENYCFTLFTAFKNVQFGLQQTVEGTKNSQSSIYSTYLGFLFVNCLRWISCSILSTFSGLLAIIKCLSIATCTSSSIYSIARSVAKVRLTSSGLRLLVRAKEPKRKQRLLVGLSPNATASSTILIFAGHSTTCTNSLPSRIKASRIRAVHTLHIYGNQPSLGASWIKEGILGGQLFYFPNREEQTAPFQTSSLFSSSIRLASGVAEVIGQQSCRSPMGSRVTLSMRVTFGILHRMFRVLFWGSDYLSPSAAQAMTHSGQSSLDYSFEGAWVNAFALWAHSVFSLFFLSFFSQGTARSGSQGNPQSKCHNEVFQGSPNRLHGEWLPTELCSLCVVQTAVAYFSRIAYKIGDQLRCNRDQKDVFLERGIAVLSVRLGILHFKFGMITSLFLSIPSNATYDDLKSPIKFVQDFAGVAGWVMRFPRIIYSSDLHFRHTFIENEVTIEKVERVELEDKWKYFVITRADGRKHYCTSQVYYEKAPLKCQGKPSFLFRKEDENYAQFYMPKCLVLLSELPYYKLQVNLLKIYKEIKKPQPCISHTVYERLYKSYLYLRETGRERDWETFIIRPELYEGKKIQCSVQFSFGYYINNCNTHKAGEVIYMEPSTDKEVLHLYKLNSSSLFQICYIYHLPFSPPTLRRILSAIFQQKQVIFACDNQNLNTLIIETILHMILPLKWCYMYVPNLPVHLIEAAQESFMPFIVGVTKSSLGLINLEDKVVIDVEEDQVRHPPDMQLFHPSLEQYLTYKNTEMSNYLEWEKQIRLKSILLVASLIEESLYMRNELIQAYLQRKIYSGEYAFLREFISSSMMYKKFKEDRLDDTYKQFYELLMCPKQQRKHYLSDKFNQLIKQTKEPVKLDNEKNWLKYYEREAREKKKFRFNRRSLNISQMSSHSLTRDSTVTSTSNSSIYLGGRNSFLTQSSLHVHS